MMKGEKGFTIVELLITMLIFVMVIAAASNIFSSLLNQFKQQSKIAETNIEGVVGLEMMRSDIQQAGYGLPWNVELNGNESGDDVWADFNVAGANYQEAVGATGTAADPGYYNDGAPASALPAGGLRAPRAILAENLGGPLMGAGAATWRSDRLVVKATSIGTNAAAPKWTYISNTPAMAGSANTLPRNWGANYEDLAAGDIVIVMRPSMGAGSSQLRVLLANAGVAPPTYSVSFSLGGLPAAFEPTPDTFMTHIVYGVGGSPLRSPFNRADYYVRRPASMPSQCAPNTGILYKAVMNHANGQFTELPLLDCVADMQVVLLTDVNNDGVLEWWGLPGMNHWTTGLTAQEIREQLREVRIYVLAHEGQRDPFFTFTNFSAGCAGVANCIRVGDFDNVGNLLGREFDLSWIDATTFSNYRWKVYTMSMQMPNLR